MLRHSLTNVLSNSARKWCRTHTRANERDGLPRAFFAPGRRVCVRLGSLGRKREHARSSCATSRFSLALSSIREDGRRKGQNVAFCFLFSSFSSSSSRFRHPVVLVDLRKSESISCLYRPRRLPRSARIERKRERLVLRRRRFCRSAEWSFGEGPFC